MIISRSIHAAWMAFFHSLSWLSGTPLCAHTCTCAHTPPRIFSVHPSVDGHLLACLGRCEECCCEHGGVGIFSSLILSGCVSRSGAPGPYGSPGCSFLRALYSVSTVAAQSTVPHIFFILLVVDGRLERSHVLTVVNVLLWELQIQIFVSMSVFIWMNGQYSLDG